MPKELSELEKKRALQINHHKKIDYALAKAFINDADLYDLINDFFREYLDLKYEFTHEELTHELNKMFIQDALKKRITTFLDHIAYLQYNAQKLPGQEEIRSLIKEFKQIVNGLITFEEKRPVSFWEQVQDKFKGLFGGKKELASKSTSQLLVNKEEHSSPKTSPGLQPESSQQKKDSTPQQPKASPEQQIQQLVPKINDLLNQNQVPQAKQLYLQLNTLFNGLPPEKKQQFYHDVHIIYMRLK